MMHLAPTITFFFFNDTATTDIYTLSLHDALPIFFFSKRNYCRLSLFFRLSNQKCRSEQHYCESDQTKDRKSTRLNSSHMSISYAVFCLKKKKKIKITIH